MNEEAKTYAAAYFKDKGVACFWEQDYRSAVQYYNKAIEMDITKATSYYDRARALFAMEDFEGALEDILRAMELDGGNYVFKNLYGLCMFFLGQQIEAERAIDEVFGYYAEREDDLTAMEEFQLIEADKDTALSFYTKALEDDPGWAEAYAIRGELQYMYYDHTNALKSMEKALAMDPGLTEYYPTLIDLYERTGKHKKASDLLDRYIELEPHNIQAIIARHELEERYGDDEAAAKDLEKIREMAPEHPYLLQYQKGNDAQAEPELQLHDPTEHLLAYNAAYKKQKAAGKPDAFARSYAELIASGNGDSFAYAFAHAEEQWRGRMKPSEFVDHYSYQIAEYYAEKYDNSAEINYDEEDRFNELRLMAKASAWAYAQMKKELKAIEFSKKFEEHFVYEYYASAKRQSKEDAEQIIEKLLGPFHEKIHETINETNE